jgi:hypothetical protein
MTMIPLISGQPATMGACTAEGCPDGWITPGDTRAEEDSVNSAVLQLDADMRASASVSLLQAWTVFRAEWGAWYASQGGLFGWLSRFATATPYEKALDYRRQLTAWRGKYMAEGGSPSGPGLVDKPPPAKSEVTSALRWAAIAAIALGAVYVVSQTGIARGLVPRTNGRRRRRR